MSRIRGTNTTPERIYRAMNPNLDFQPELFGRPDFANWRGKTVIFIDGCFWHKCSKHFRWPKTNRRYWLPKIRRNVRRDMEVTLAYKNSGWKVVRIWEHDVK